MEGPQSGEKAKLPVSPLSPRKQTTAANGKADQIPENAKNIPTGPRIQVPTGPRDVQKGNGQTRSSNNLKEQAKPVRSCF